MGKWKVPSIGVLTAIVLAATVFLIYYIRTPSETLVVVTAPLPRDWAPGFSEEEMSESLLASIQEVRLGSKSSSASGTNAGLQVAQPAAPYVSWSTGLPSFDQQIYKITPNMVRQWALTAKAKHFLHLNTIKSGQAGFRLFATFQDRPDFAVLKSWQIPSAQESCPQERPDVCTGELAEDLLAYREPRTAVLYELRQQSAAAYAKVDSFYTHNIIPTSDPASYYAWADAQQGLRRYDDAIVNYRRALTMDHALCGAYDAIGISDIRAYELDMHPKRLDAAEEAYRQALACNPQDAVAHCDMGNVFIRKWKAGSYKDVDLEQKAVAENEIALRLDPGRIEAAVNLGYVQYMHGERSKAIDYFRDLGRDHPESSIVFVNLGFLLFKEYVQGNKNALQESLDMTQKAWDLDHNSSVIADNLAILYFEVDRLSDAVKTWQTADALAPSSPDILAGYALGLFKSGKVDEAISYYKEAVRRDFDARNPQILRDKYLWTEKAIREIQPLDSAAFPAEKPAFPN